MGFMSNWFQFGTRPIAHIFNIAHLVNIVHLVNLRQMQVDKHPYG
jgi:hypothetical protein